MTTKNGKAIARSKRLKEEVAAHRRNLPSLLAPNSPSTEECPTDEAAAVCTFAISITSTTVDPEKTAAEHVTFDATPTHKM